MLLIRNACLIDMAGTWRKKRNILISDGRFADITETDGPEPDCEVIDAAGRLVTPGLIESHCHLGMGDASGQDINEKTGPIQPALRAMDAVDLRSDDFREALETGVTTLAVGPGSSNLIGGTFMIVKSAGESPASQVVKEEFCMKMALGENPKGNYGPRGKMPATRMGEAALIRKTLCQAREYRKKWMLYNRKREQGEDCGFEFDLNLHSLMRVFDGMPVKIHVHKANDIMTAIRIGQEFQLNYTLEHCTEGYLLFDELREAGVMPILGPVTVGKGKAELAGKRFDAPALFEKAGIPFAVTTDSGVIPMEGLLMQLAILVKNGLSEVGAYESVTVNAAKAIGMWDELGSIERGKTADLVIWDRDPLATGGRAGIVVIGGEVRYWA